MSTKRDVIELFQRDYVMHQLFSHVIRAFVIFKALLFWIIMHNLFLVLFSMFTFFIKYYNL